MRTPLLLSALLVTAAAVTSARASAGVSPRILGGRPAPSAEATVALRDATGRLICSGVLVGPRAVLTAAHCLPLPAALAGGEGDPTPGPADVCFGSSVDACASAPRVSGFELHPGWDPLTFQGDLAIVTLASDAPVRPVTPATPAARALVDRGAALEIIGFGRTDPTARTSAGERRATATTVDEIENGRVVHGEAACNGDSGGPLFAAADPTTVVAITSSGPTGCRDFGRATLVAPHEVWIDERVRASETDPGDGASCAVSGRSGRQSGWTALMALLFAITCASGRRADRPCRPSAGSSR